MDRFKRKRKRNDGQKKVLLSIVDPWDVRVASVDPIGLAERRGVSLSILPSQLNGNTVKETLHPGRIVKLPSPWYKPTYSNVIDSPTDDAAVKNSSSESAWVDPWHCSNRPMIEARPSSPETWKRSSNAKQSEQKNTGRYSGLRNVQTIPDGNGLIVVTPEIVCNNFDHEHAVGTVARVRFENEDRPRSSTWTPSLGEKESVTGKSHLYATKSIHLPSSSYFQNGNTTPERSRLVETRTSNADDEEDIQKKRYRITEDAETLKHGGSFEDRELVNVVQNLVTSRYPDYYRLLYENSSKS